MSDDINAAIAAIVADMQDLGLPNVYGVLPLMADGGLLKTQFTVANGGSPYLAGWTVTWRTAQLVPNETFGEWNSVIAVEGWRGWAGDAGQAQMNAWLQSLLPVLWDHATLGGAVQNVADVRVSNNEPRISFDVLCHYGRIDLTTWLVF